MKAYFALLLVSLLPPALVSCRDSTLIEEPEVGRIFVQVLELGSNVPEAGVKIQVLETGEIKTTDSNGVSTFVVIAGTYTVRVFGLNHGGPIRLYEDIPVNITPNGRKVLTLFDCIFCV